MKDAKRRSGEGIRGPAANSRGELAEIDENLIRADLSPAERKLHIYWRKELYEAEHPKTKQGAAAGKAGGGKKVKDRRQRRLFRAPARRLNGDRAFDD